MENFDLETNKEEVESVAVFELDNDDVFDTALATCQVSIVPIP